MPAPMIHFPQASLKYLTLPPPPSPLSLLLSLSSDSHCWIVCASGGTNNSTVGRNEAGVEALTGSDDPHSPPLTVCVFVGGGATCPGVAVGGSTG